MCLTANVNTSNEFKKNNSGTITVWKVYEKQNNKLFSPYREGKPIRSGVINSNRFTTRYPLEDEGVALYNRDLIYLKKGIHVCLTRKDARTIKHSFYYGIFVIVKCQADMKDFVACDTIESKAVFTKVTITPEEFERGLKNRN